jgi:hypothetical protein
LGEAKRTSVTIKNRIMTKIISHQGLEKFHVYFDATNPNKDYPTYVKNVLCDIFLEDNDAVYK